MHEHVEQNTGAAYIEGGLTRAEKRVVDEHLADCRDCRQVMLFAAIPDRPATDSTAPCAAVRKFREHHFHLSQVAPGGLRCCQCEARSTASGGSFVSRGPIEWCQEFEWYLPEKAAELCLEGGDRR